MADVSDAVSCRHALATLSQCPICDSVERKEFSIMISAMADLPIGYRQKFRELTYGPIAWGAWSWSFHDGSTWVALYFDGAQTLDNFVAWATVTEEIDLCPVVGCYVAESHRGKGIAEIVVNILLRDLVSSRKLHAGATVYARAAKKQSADVGFRKYPELIEAAGLEFEEWE